MNKMKPIYLMLMLVLATVSGCATTGVPATKSLLQGEVPASGLAPLTGNIVVIGAYPEVVDAAVLLACPCDIAKWRSANGRSMYVRSQSPSRFVDQVPLTTKVVAITGAKDDNTRPFLAESYVGALQKRGVDAQVFIVPGAGHHRLSEFRTELLNAFSGFM